MTFKVGDKVRVAANTNGGHNEFEGEIMEISNGYHYVHNNDVCGSNGDIYPSKYKYSWAVRDSQIGGFTLLETKTNKMDILKKLALTLKGEPEKSFIKAEITSSDDLLTDEGQKIFLSWLLKKQGTDFKKEGVDVLLADKEEEAK